MPTYDYVCDACNHAFEEWQSFHDEELTKCPACKKKKLRRLMGTGATIIFKGSGFYETDYRKDSYKAAEKADSDAAKPAEKTDTPAAAPAATTDKKAEPKVEATPVAAPAPAPASTASKSAKPKK